MKKNKKALWGWIMYDVANSAYWTSIVAGFFPIMFKQYWTVGANVNQSTALLGFSNSTAALILAIIAPLLGAFSDAGFLRKKMLIIFAYLGAIACAALFFVGAGNTSLAITIYILSSIFFIGSNIFYNALLPRISKGYNMDMVSSLGYAFGYLGGGTLFLVNVAMVLFPTTFGIADATQAVRIAFLSVAIWVGFFTLFTAFWVPKRYADPQYNEQHIPANLFITAWKNVFHTLRSISHYKMAVLFLIAYWLYIDGVDTIIVMAVDYGLSIGFNANDLIVALLIIQFVAFPFAYLWGKLASIWDIKACIYLAILGYIAIVIAGVIMKNLLEFYLIAASIGLFQGGIQALSRSYFARFIPESKSAEFFGFYNLIGRFAAILGPFLMGISALLARSYLLPVNPTKAQLIEVSHQAARFSIGSILILFVLGAIIFYFVKTPDQRPVEAG